MSSIRRYELSDKEWESIAPLLPAENTGRRGRPAKDNRVMFNAIVWLAKSGAAWRDLPERYGPWESVYSRFRKWLNDGVLDNIFRVLSLEAELLELSIDSTVVRAHQASAGAKKGAAVRKSAEAAAD
jgi:transposase